MYSAVWPLHGWCHVKLLPSRRVLCTPYNYYHATSHTLDACVFSCSCTFGRMTVWLLLFLQMGEGGLKWGGGGGGGETTANTELRVGTESSPQRKNVSRQSYRDSNPGPFDHESGALTTELSWWFLRCIYINTLDNPFVLRYSQLNRLNR